MRYLLLTYYTKPSGQIDEVMTIANKIKTRDWQTANVILDFKEQKVLAASVKGMTATRDWDIIVSYYYKHYSATIERLFQENGHILPEVDQKTVS
jgi:hypothetical protein